MSAQPLAEFLPDEVAEVADLAVLGSLFFGHEESWVPVREVPHTLPAERDAFVGRLADLGELADALDGGDRLVSLLGPGGTGKTRLAALRLDLAR